MHYFQRGRSLYEVPDALLLVFGVVFGMIDPDHLDNMRQLLNPAMPGKRHLNGMQPFVKLVWVQPWIRTAAIFKDHRPRPAPAPEFYADFIKQLNAEGNGGKSIINNKQTFGKFLNGTYYPAGKSKPPTDHYCEWERAVVILEEAKELMDFQQPVQWMQARAVAGSNRRAALAPRCLLNAHSCALSWLTAVPFLAQVATAAPLVHDERIANAIARAHAAGETAEVMCSDATPPRPPRARARVADTRSATRAGAGVGWADSRR